MDADEKAGLFGIGIAIGLQIFLLSEGMYQTAGWGALMFLCAFIGSIGTGYHR